MKFKKATAFVLAMMCAATVISGCGNNKIVDGKINVSIGEWPDETNKDNLEKQNKMKDEFMKANPDINIIPDTYKYDTQTFNMKASGNQLPTAFRTWFTETQQLIKAGYVADITEQLKAHGFADAINPQVMKYVTSDDGKIYGLPTDAYVMGLIINKKLFTEAGLVNSDGSVKIPQTYEEVAEFSKIIHEKTGQAGFIIPTINNQGGWIFMNIAWSYGVEWEKQREDGSWEATFDTQETRDAFNYLKDLKWKYNAFNDDMAMDSGATMKYLAIDQAAMIINEPSMLSWLTSGYGMDVDNIVMAKVPGGPKGRYAQMGGGVWMFPKNATAEQIDAGLKWLEFTGISPNLTEEQIQNTKTSFEQTLASNGVVLDREGYDLWVSPERIAQSRELRKDYANVDPKNIEDYYNSDDVEVQVEPAACAQQLYAILDKCIQEVLTNENTDVDKLVSDACKDFQANHLDKMK